MDHEVNQNGNEIFIIDDEAIKVFFKNKNFESAQMFFDYLTVKCKNKKAYMIPSIFGKIMKRIKERTKEKGDPLQTEVIAWIKNWVEEADLLGVDKGDEKQDTLLLYKILKVLNPNEKIIILSGKYQNEDVESLRLEDIQSYLLNKKDFVEYLTKNYGYEDGATY